MVGQLWLSRTPHPLRSARITRLHRYCGVVRPCALPSVLCLSLELEGLPSTVGRGTPRPIVPDGWTDDPKSAIFVQRDRFPRSVTEPKPCSRHLNAGHHLGSKQVAPRLLPRHRTNLGFDVVDGFSTRHQWFTCVRLRGLYLTHWWCAFSLLLTTPALDRRSVGWFGTSSCKAVPEDLPPSLLQHTSDWSILWTSPSFSFVA
jgi:hypothetical protein